VKGVRVRVGQDHAVPVGETLVGAASESGMFGLSTGTDVGIQAGVL
jgi:hypothetical protein